MPVLTVSEKTWPQVGFSRKRCTRSSSSTMVMPNSSGSGTRVRQTVTSAPLSWWNLHQVGEVEVGQRVAGDDEERCRRAAGRSAFLTLPAVPSGRLLGGVVQAHAELLAVAEVVADEAGEELHRHDGLGEAVPLRAAAARAP